jgi:putative hemolysin
MENRFHRLFLITMAAFLAMVMACANASPPEAKDPTEKKTGPTMANPAATRCLNDGHRLEPVIENGIPKGYLCVDPETGKKCEVWDYFHKRCDME